MGGRVLETSGNLFVRGQTSQKINKNSLCGRCGDGLNQWVFCGLSMGKLERESVQGWQLFREETKSTEKLSVVLLAVVL